MNRDRTIIGERNSPMFNSKPGASRVTKPMIFIGCLLINLIPMATSASAHVKWFVVCDVSDDPLPIGVVFTKTFFLCAALFLTLFYFACEVEQTAFGAAFLRFLDRLTEPLHRRKDELLRAVAAVSFALLWADGGLILTPELKASDPRLAVIQLLIPLYLFARATLPAAGVGILVLYGYGAVTYGPFHMLDYPVFIGLGVYFALSVSRTSNLLAFRLDVLRWSVALSLLWPSMEKFVYPAWVAPIAITHPELTLGFDVDTVVTAAGVVEFGLAFALCWTPLVRRLAALALMLLLTAATFDFGKVDGIGHLMIIAILLVVFADPGRMHAGCRPALAPLVSCAVWLSTVLLYSGAHALYYRSQNAALVALAVGVATVGVIFFCLRTNAQVSSRTTARRPRQGFIGNQSDSTGETDAESSWGAPGASGVGIWPVAPGRRRRSTASGLVAEVWRRAIDRGRDGVLWGAFFLGRTRTQTE